MAKELYIRFMVTINPTTARQLIECLDNSYRRGCPLVHLMISTSGGSVKDGIDLYNYISTLPMPVHTYNMGQMDAIGTAVFCAGRKRFSAQFAKFLFHPVSIDTFNRFDEHLVHELLSSAKVDRSNIAKIIAGAMREGEQAILEKMRARLVLTPEEAKAEKLVHAIDSKIIPKRADILAIKDAHTDQRVRPSIGTPTTRRTYTMPARATYRLPAKTYCTTLHLQAS